MEILSERDVAIDGGVVTHETTSSSRISPHHHFELFSLLSSFSPNSILFHCLTKQPKIKSRRMSLRYRAKLQDPASASLTVGDGSGDQDNNKKKNKKKNKKASSKGKVSNHHNQNTCLTH
jgi:hypothetical protein